MKEKDMTPKKKNFLQEVWSWKWYRKVTIAIPLIAAVLGIMSTDPTTKMFVLGIQLGFLIKMLLEMPEYLELSDQRFKEWADQQLEILDLKLKLLHSEAKFETITRTIENDTYGAKPSTSSNTQRVHQTRKNKQVPRSKTQKRSNTTRRVGSKNTARATRKDK